MSVLAGLAGADAAADPLRLIGDAHSMRSAAARSRLAHELAQDIAAVAKRVGAPGPEESAEVVAELAAIDRLRDPGAVHVRAQRVHASPAFQHLRLSNTLAAVLDALECAASPYGSVRREMACWSIAATYLSDRIVHDDGLDALTRSGRLAYGGGMTRARWLAQSELWSRYGTAINDYIVIPYLRSAPD